MLVKWAPYIWEYMDESPQWLLDELGGDVLVNIYFT